MREHNTNFGMIAGVAAFSAAAGALAASMMMPKSGREMRNDIKEKASDMRETAKDKVSSSEEPMAKDMV